LSGLLGGQAGAILALLRGQVLAAVLLAACGKPPERPATARSADGAAEAIAPPPSADAAVPREAGEEGQAEVLLSLDASAPATAAAPAGPVSARFVRDGALTRQARLVAAALAGAADAGLDPAEYGGGAWTDRFRALDEGRAMPEEADRLESDLRAAALRFARALRHGRVRPQALGYALPPEPFDAMGFVDALAAAADSAALLDGLAPRVPAYAQLIRALPRLRALAERRRGAPPLPLPARPLRPGERYAAAPRLADLLAALGDLEEPQRAAASSKIISPELAAALRRFQARHALPQDGVVGRRTVQALNVPLDRRVAQVELALERWRWMPRELGPRWIVVNVPAQRLEAVEAERPRETLAMDVIVGATKEDRRTPVLAARVHAIMFSPYWDVPEKLAAGDLARLLARRPDLAEGDGFFVEVDGARLPVGRRTLALVRRGEARLRQRPGPRNSLGPLRVVMPNPSDVYLHGTAKPRLFNRNDRALSHGCIRLAEPAALAAFLLAGQPGFDRARIDAAMMRAEPLLVSLATPATALLVYATATADEDGTLRFWPDLYGADARLERALSAERARSRPVPGAQPPRVREIGRGLARDAARARGGDAAPARGGAGAADARPGGATFQADPAAFDTGGSG
jgi:murein L,D-transpeptidase YcbB/YkuD